VFIFMTGFLAWWSKYYGNHQLASVSIRSMHLTALMLGGGTGLFADRQILRARRAGAKERDQVMAMLHKAHPYVIAWTAVLAMSGALMMAADISTFWSSRVFWIKVTLVALLCTNGVAMLLIENRTRRAGINQWNSLVLVSTFSAILWLTTLFVGTLLTVAA
jgi:hypothetical protein